MSFFKTQREKRYWFFALIVVLAIFSTFVFGLPLQKFLVDQEVQFYLFLTGFILTGITVIVNGIIVKQSKLEWVVWIGILAVYVMLIFRLGAPERSHLMEFSVLAILIHKALQERYTSRNLVLIPAVLAFTFTSIIGILDEGIQYFLPNRVFDPEDLVFNTLAAFMAISAALILQWASRKFRGIKQI